MRDAVAVACAVYAALSAADCAAPVILDDNIVFAISLARALFFLIRFSYIFLLPQLLLLAVYYLDIPFPFSLDYR